METERILPPLPDTVLVKIFKDLPLKDRKNVRLTCKLWQTLCSRKNIIKHEKYVFRHHYQKKMKFLGESIIKCKKFRKEVGFSGLYISKLPSDVWKHLGKTVKDLTFTNCLLDSKATLNIITHCPNSNLYFRSDDYRSAKESNNSLGELIKYEALREYQKVTQKSLKIPNSYLKMAQTIFGINYKINLPQYYSCVGFTSWCLPFCLPEAQNRFSYCFLIGCLCQDGFLILTNFFSNQSSLLELLRVDMFVIDKYPNRDVDVKDLLLTILTTLPKLRLLEFIFYDSQLVFTQEELKLFLERTTYLQHLRLRFKMLCLDNYTSPSMELQLPETRGNKLISLDVHFTNRLPDSERIQVEIIQANPYIQNLYLKNAGEVQLYFVLTHLTELKYLYLKYDDKGKCYDGGFYFPNSNDPNIIYSSHTYTKLKSLHIRIGKDLVGRFFKEDGVNFSKFTTLKKEVREKENSDYEVYYSLKRPGTMFIG